MKPANHLYSFILILIVLMALGSCECQPELKVEGDNKVEAKKKSAEETENTDEEDDTPEGIPLDEHNNSSDETQKTDANKEGSEQQEEPETGSTEQKENGEEKEPGKECDSKLNNDASLKSQPTDGQTDPKATNPRRTKTVVAGEIMNLLAGLTNKSTVEGKKFLEKLDQQLKTTKSGTSGFPFGSLEDLKTQNKPEELKSSLQYIQGLLQSTLKNAQSEWEKDLKGTVKIKNCNDVNVVLAKIYQKIKELEVGNLPEN